MTTTCSAAQQAAQGMCQTQLLSHTKLGVCPGVDCHTNTVQLLQPPLLPPASPIPRFAGSQESTYAHLLLHTFTRASMHLRSLASHQQIDPLLLFTPRHPAYHMLAFAEPSAAAAAVNGPPLVPHSIPPNPLQLAGVPGDKGVPNCQGLLPPPARGTCAPCPEAHRS
jgi:hypothetical protein